MVLGLRKPRAWGLPFLFFLVCVWDLGFGVEDLFLGVRTASAAPRDAWGFLLSVWLLCVWPVAALVVSWGVLISGYPPSNPVSLEVGGVSGGLSDSKTPAEVDGTRMNLVLISPAGLQIFKREHVVG